MYIYICRHHSHSAGVCIWYLNFTQIHEDRVPLHDAFSNVVRTVPIHPQGKTLELHMYPNPPACAPKQNLLGRVLNPTGGGGGSLPWEGGDPHAAPRDFFFRLCERRLCGWKVEGWAAKRCFFGWPPPPPFEWVELELCHGIFIKKKKKKLYKRNTKMAGFVCFGL